MSITAGTKLGRYEIGSQIGAGGMGEVLPGERPEDRPRYIAGDRGQACNCAIRYN